MMELEYTMKVSIGENGKENETWVDTATITFRCAAEEPERAVRIRKAFDSVPGLKVVNKSTKRVRERGTTK